MDIQEELVLKKYMPNKSSIKNMVDFFSAFSDDTRLKIVILLTIKPVCVTTISTVLNINQSTVSHQLQLLKSLDIAECERSGKNVYYYVKKKSIVDIFDCVVDCI